MADDNVETVASLDPGSQGVFNRWVEGQEWAERQPQVDWFCGAAAAILL